MPRTRPPSYPPAVAAPPRPTQPTDALLTSAVEEAARLLHADGAMVYLLDPATGRLRFAHDAGIKSPRSRAWVRAIELEPGSGMFGRAVAERAVVATGDYPADPSFRHADEADRVVADLGIRSMVVAPLSNGTEVLGALGTFSGRLDAFDPAQIALVRSLADHAAAAIANARLIQELDRSRQTLAERADVEYALREITARISAAADLSSVLQLAVDEAARLVRADGARIDLIDPRSRLLRWAYASGAHKPDDEVWPDDPDETLEQGVSGQAVISGKPFWTGDYGRDPRFPHGRGADTYVGASGIASVMAAPLIGDAGAFGALTVFTDRPDAWDESDAAILESIATQAAIAITRARLIEELGRSRAKLARRAAAEQSLREVAARITALRDPAEILQEVVELASRLVGGEGAILDLLDPETGDLRWAFDDGLDRLFSAEERANLWISVGVGATGIAVQEDRVVIAGDDLVSLFPSSPESTQFYERTGFHSMIAAPITGESGPLGVVEVYAVARDAFDDADADLIRALAGQAAIAITNARLIDELERSQAALARRVETERSLRAITARIAALQDPDEVLERVVEDAKRLLGTDGAHLTRIAASGTHLVPAVVAGAADDVTRSWLMAMEFPLGGGINGLAAQHGVAVTTFDYLADPRIPHEPEDLEVAERLGLRGMAATPLRAPGGEVIGTLAVSSATPRTFRVDELDLLDGLADQAAIALTNSNLLERLTREEARFRGLVQTTPDIIWQVDHGGHFTFMADSGSILFGWPIKEIIGQQFGMLTDPGSMPLAMERFRAVGAQPDLLERVPLTLVRRDGSTFAAEVTTIGVFEDGQWVGAQGTVRDVSQRERLEHELRRQAGELAAGEERAHLARELHDSVTQALFSMTMVTRSIELLLDRDPTGARDQLVQLRELQREALAEMRALIFELRPGNLEQDGLVRALKTHASALQGRLGLPVVVEGDLDRRLPLAVEEVLYRIAQEALHNVVKHAKARQVRLGLDRPDDGVRLRIQDDGRGFDPGLVPDGHLGLAGMLARAERIGATFSCESRPGEGTTISVSLSATDLAALSGAVGQGGDASRSDLSASIRDG